MKIGAHESTAGGLYKAIERAQADALEALQIFVKSPNRWSAPKLSEEDVYAFKRAASAFPVSSITAHAAYLINLASPKEDVLERSKLALKDELSRCDTLEIPYYVMHPGSSLDSSLEEGLERIVEGIDTVYEEGGYSTMLLLETTCGAGNMIGGRLEHLEGVIDLVKRPEKVGVCLDSCHMYSSGYDLVSAYQKVTEEVVRRFGEKVKVFHLNDSKFGLSTRKDRHELIGQGVMGLEVFKNIVNDKSFENVLGILETPIGEKETYKEEAETLRKLAVGGWRAGAT